MDIRVSNNVEDGTSAGGEYDAGMKKGSNPPGETDADAGVWQGRSVARVAESPDGMTVLIGRTARDNDVLSLRLASPRDFWFHVAGESGSHVVVRNPDNLDALPRETKRFAAGLAAGYSKARKGGKVAVHMARAGDVSKPRGLAPGKVHLRRFVTVHSGPLRLDDEGRSQ
jgi:hypothetical protein